TGGLETPALRGGPDSQVHSRLCQPQGAVRGTLEGPLSDRSNRPEGESATGARRPNRSNSDPSKKASATDPNHHWRLVQQRAAVGGPGSAKGRLTRSGRPA